MSNNHKDAIRAILEAHTAKKTTALLLAIAEGFPSSVVGAWVKVKVRDKMTHEGRPELSICAECKK